MKKLLTTILFIVTFTIIHATEFSVYEANYPNVKDYNVRIDEATLVVHHLGSYVEMNIYMTVSYDFNSWFFKNYNELEFKWQFNLPVDAIVHKFWIWDGDSILSAKVLDKWTAELLFSDVSSPVRNPGLLTQSSPNSDGQVTHDVRIFPIKRNEKKRFMIQYLLPCRPTGSQMRVWLPMTQLISDKTPIVNKMRLLYKYGNTPHEPKVIGAKPSYSQNFPSANAWAIDLPVEKDQFVELEIPSPIKKDVYFTTTTSRGENFYQIAVIPPNIPRSATPRNILFVIDFNRFNTANLDGDFLLSYLKESLLQAFSKDDSINVLVAYDDYILGDKNWVSCTKEGIDNLFSKVMKRSFPSYNNLLPLISRAADFVNTRQTRSEVLFITNINTINLYGTDKTQLASSIIAKFKSGTGLNFMDLDNKSYLYWNSGGYYETQMQSFYGSMSYNTGGDLFFLKYNTLKEMIYSFLYDEISHFESVEVQLRFNNGFANSKHFIGLNQGYYPMNTPILQLGKFTGGFPVDVTVFGKYRTTSKNYTVTINQNQVEKGSEQIATAWYGGYIQSLLKLPYNPLTISDIIKLSSEQEILTPYSGFLIFEKDKNHGYCTTCIDETKGATDVKDLPDSTYSFEITAFPNPFNPSTTINYTLPSNGIVTLRIYNILGEKVAELVNTEQAKGKHSVRFDGSKLASGLYIMSINLKAEKANYVTNKKLLLMK